MDNRSEINLLGIRQGDCILHRAEIESEDSIDEAAGEYLLIYEGKLAGL